MSNNKTNSPWLEDQLDAAQSAAEREEIIREWGKEKLACAEQKEAERLNAPSVIDKLRASIAKLKKKSATKKISGREKTR